MSTRGTFRRRGARVDAIEDGVDKGELLARAREATRATYGEEEEARGAIGASSSAAGTWDALRGGVAALACARMAFEESFEAVVVRPVRSRRARRLEREGSEEEAWEEAREAREAARETAARRP